MDERHPTNRISRLLDSPLPLGIVLALALSLRVWGLVWGLPSATHYFSYHPDESVVLEAAMNMNVFTGHLLPGFYNYGSLQLYFINFANSLVYVFGGVNIIIKNLATDYDQWARMYLIGRSLTVAMGVGTVWATYTLGLRLWGRSAGLLGALLLAITPLHAQHSHWMTVDVPATFWVTLSLLWASKIDAHSKPIRAALWAGLFAGLAAATKYNMALVLLPCLLACWTLRTPRAPRAFLAALGGALAAFLIGCPGAVLDTREFAGDIRYEFVHVSRQPGITFEHTGNGFLYVVTHSLTAGLGLPLVLFALASIIYAAVRRTRGDGLLAAFALPYYLMIGAASVRYARYAIPLLPLLALWSGRLLADWTRPRPWPLRFSRVALSAAVLVLTFADCVQIVSAMALPDPRDRAFLWLRDNFRPGATLAYATLPWFQTPPVNPYFSLPQPGGWRRPQPPDQRVHINFYGSDWSQPSVSRDWNMEALAAQRPTLVIMTEYGYADALRLHDPQARAFIGLLRQNYTQAAEFSGPPPLFRLRRTRDGLPVMDLPHDMLYPEPTVLIYRRRED